MMPMPESVCALVKRFTEVTALLNEIDSLAYNLVDLTGKVDVHLTAFAAEIEHATGVKMPYPADPSGLTT